MIKHVWQALLEQHEIDVEDSGTAKNWEMPSDFDLFVRVQSYADDRNHSEFDALIGKRVRITIEVIEDNNS